jgi:hypothetical protein
VWSQFLDRESSDLTVSVICEDLPPVIVHQGPGDGGLIVRDKTAHDHRTP